MTKFSYGVLSGLLQMQMNAVRSPPIDKLYAVNIAKALQDIAADGHERNRAAGWWSNPDGSPKERNVGEMLMLSTSELAEFPPYPFSMEIMDDKLPQWLMAEVELADCLIRLFDMAGGKCPLLHYAYANVLSMRPIEGKLPQLPQHLAWKNADEGLMFIVRSLSGAMESARKDIVVAVDIIDEHTGTPDASRVTIPGFTLWIAMAIYGCFYVAGQLGFNDLHKAIVQKMEFNANREDHKREVRNAPGGKKF